ncbi:hypothetical protein DYB32_009853 [Aphanomyces invadans]|uniref:Peptidase A2 domain-containing protein n=1 Tax=Aphanomyces invadans TaxID=157072 RepID=A0A418AHL4_9STRA|nr:hypothetical protein DYB32_009853 [Aphanomyces invadans]
MSQVQSTDHKVSDCPKAASDEAEGLIQAQIKGRKEARDKRATANMIDLSRERTKIEGRAVVCEVVPVDQLLLDTGASVNVVSAELFSALKKAKADVQVVVDDTPTALYPYGKTSTAVMLSRRLRMSVALETTCGPLLLRGMLVWIDER